MCCVNHSNESSRQCTCVPNVSGCYEADKNTSEANIRMIQQLKVTIFK